MGHFLFPASPQGYSVNGVRKRVSDGLFLSMLRWKRLTHSEGSHLGNEGHQSNSEHLPTVIARRVLKTSPHRARQVKGMSVLVLAGNDMDQQTGESLTCPKRSPLFNVSKGKSFLFFKKLEIWIFI